MITKRLLLLGILFIFSCLSIKLNAQPDLSKNKKFFKQHLSEYKAWLETTGLNAMVEIDRFEVKKDRLILFLNNSEEYRNPELLAEVWMNTREQFNEAFGLSPEKIMLQKLAHIMELSPEKTRIEVDGISSALFHLSIYYKQGAFTIEEEMDEVRGNNDKLILKLEEIGFFAATDKLSQAGQLREIKKRLLDGLNEFFSKSDTKFGNEPNVEFIRNTDNEFTLMVSNVTNQIITRYFELINLNVELYGEDGEFEISYSIFGKYGSGIFSAPRATSSDYTDMFPEYSAEINLYVDKLGQTISSILKK